MPFFVRSIKNDVFWRLALVFILFPVAELFVLWGYGRLFGTFLGPPITLLTLVGTALLGAAVAKRQGLRCWLELHRELDRGETPTLPILHGFCILLAGLLLVMPGLITDMLGLLLLVPPVRSFVIARALTRFEAYRLRRRDQVSPESPEVIDID